jgi:hypothetical protein
MLIRNLNLLKPAETFRNLRSFHSLAMCYVAFVWTHERCHPPKVPPLLVPRAEVGRAKFYADIPPLRETVKNPGAD